MRFGWEWKGQSKEAYRGQGHLKIKRPMGTPHKRYGCSLSCSADKEHRDIEFQGLHDLSHKARIASSDDATLTNTFFDTLTTFLLDQKDKENAKWAWVQYTKGEEVSLKVKLYKEWVNYKISIESNAFEKVRWR